MRLESTIGRKCFGVQIAPGFSDVCVHIMFAVPLGYAIGT